MTLKFTSVLTIPLTIIIYTVAFYLQSHILLNVDTSLLMHATDRVLHGGKYGIDFFDTDPPMILYVYMIPVIAAKIFSTNFINASFFFIFSLTLFSLVLSDFYIEYLEDKTAGIYQRWILLPAIALILLIPPGTDFAQREHITLILILPYLLNRAARLYKMEPARFIAILTGIIAGIGFCIKPQFFLCFFFVELFFLFKSPKKITLETIMIFAITLLYVGSIYFFHPGYITTIVPLASTYYYQTLLQVTSFTAVLTYSVFLVSLILPIACFILIKNEKEIILENILFIAILSFCIIYLIQFSDWYYHILPAFSLACLFLILTYRNLAHHNFMTKILLVLIFLYFPIQTIVKYNYNSLWTNNKGVEKPFMLNLKAYPPNSSIYFLSSCLLPYPMVDYLNFKDVQLVQHFWFQSLFFKKNIHASKILQKIIYDFIKKDPDLVVIDNRANCKEKEFDYLTFFSENAAFKKQFAHYQQVAQWPYLSLYEKNRPG